MNTEDDEETTPVEQILDAVSIWIDKQGLYDDIVEVLDRNFGRDVQFARDREGVIAQARYDALHEAFSAMHSSLNISDGFLCLRLMHGEHTTEINLVDHLEGGIKAAPEAQLDTERIDSIIIGIDEFISLLQRLREAVETHRKT